MSNVLLPQARPLSASRRRRRRVVAYLAVFAAWAVSIRLSTVLSLPEPWHTLAVFAHLASLFVGFGAVLMIEWHGLQWVLRRIDLDTLRRADRMMVLPVWLGVAGLLATGAFLDPDLASWSTQLKLWSVLLLSLNGVALTRWTGELTRLPASAAFAAIPGRAKLGIIGTTIVSQLSWWTAIVLGALTTMAR